MTLRDALLFALMSLLAACSSPPQPPPTQPAAADATGIAPAPTFRVLPTLYPTSQPSSTTPPIATSMPLPTEVPDTPVSFEQTVVELRYWIPGLGLDRTILGNVSSLLEVSDEVTGDSVTRRNQTGILFELQQSLPNLTLGEVPEECALCVRLAYTLPLAELSDSGWLDDVQFLASIENFTAVTLGPHFPTETVVGLRRSATPHQVAHTVALTADGQVWRWAATESKLSESQPEESAAPELAAVLEAVDIGALPDALSAECPLPVAREVLHLEVAGERKEIQIQCPELSLPAKLLPLYTQLSELANEMLPGETMAFPEIAMPVNSLLYFGRDDGVQLNLLDGGQAVALDASGVTYTTTLTNSIVVSLTTSLTNSGSLEPGVEAFTLDENANVLVVRAPDGLYDIGWDSTVNAAVQGVIDRLEALLEDLLVDLSVRATGTPASTPSTTVTPEAGATP